MTRFDPENPLIVQSDHTVLVEVDGPRFPAARDELSRFAELIKSPEHIHTYRITPLSIWNACAAGVARRRSSRRCTSFPSTTSRARAGRDPRLRVALRAAADDAARTTLVLIADEPLAEEICRHKQVAPLVIERLSPARVPRRPRVRGKLKQALVKPGFPGGGPGRLLRR